MYAPLQKQFKTEDLDCTRQTGGADKTPLKLL